MLRSIPPVTRNLLLINIIIFMVQQVLQMYQPVGSGDVLVDTFGLHSVLASDFHIWQLFTYMFLHGSWPHVLLNMFSLWMFGRIIERTMTQRRFLIYYIVCGVGAGLCQEIWQLGEFYFTGMAHYDAVRVNGTIVPMAQYLNMMNTVGASGACYGVLLAYGMTFPNERIMLLIPPIPFKAKYFVIGYAVIEAWCAFRSNDNIAHFAHLGGMLFGFLLIRYWRLKQRRSQEFQWARYAEEKEQRGVMQSISAWFQGLGASLEDAVRSVAGWFKGSGSQNSQKQQRYDNPDYQYNQRRNEQQRKANQSRIDEILDKVKRSGYDALTDEEKRELFKDTK